MNIDRLTIYHREIEELTQPTMLPQSEDSVLGEWRETEVVIPTPEQIRFECQRIQANWDQRETLIRLLRAEMACKFGICRNL